MRYPPEHTEHLKAPPSQFRVIAVDTQETSGTYIIGDFPTVEAARQIAGERSGVGSPVYIYNDHGELVERFGSWH